MATKRVYLTEDGKATTEGALDARYIFDASDADEAAKALQANAKLAKAAEEPPKK